LTQIATGTIIGKIGRFNPFIIAGTIVTTIGCGLLFTLQVDSGSPAWIGYQVIAGIGEGLCLNVPIIVTQRIAPTEDVAVATAIVLCKYTPLRRPRQHISNKFPIVFQSFGGALVTSAAQSIFENRLLNTLPFTAPGVNPALVLAVGATNLRGNFTDAQLPGILAAYMKGLQSAFVLAIATGGVAFFIAVSQPWLRLNKPAVEA